MSSLKATAATALALVGGLLAGVAAPALPTSTAAPTTTVSTAARTAGDGNPERGLPGTNAWRLGRPAMAGQIEGYTTRASVRSGQTFALRVSTDAPRFTVSAYRIGAYKGGIGRLVWRSDQQRGARQPAAVFANRARRTVTAPWRDSLSVGTDGWPTGFYLLKLVDSRGWQSHVPLVVRPRSAAGTVALVSPVTTWQAYNTWGGYSLYEGPSGDRRAHAVSFDRPYVAPGAGQAMFGVVPVVVRAERLGIPLSYLANTDLHQHPKVLEGARGYVSMGHDEYWTLAMRKAVLDARAHGTNLAFLGANTMYWRIRLAGNGVDAGRVVVGYRSDARLDPYYLKGDPQTTAQFRHNPHPMPERSVTGMMYECFPVDQPFRVVAPHWWGFEGTGVRRGEQLPHLVGVEADRVYPVPGTPRPMQILANVSYSCRGDATSAQAVYYTTRSGAGVFNAGTLRWTCALGGRCHPYDLPPRTVSFVRRTTENVLRTFAEGRAGRTHPARDNLDRFYLPSVNQVSASRRVG